MLVAFFFNLKLGFFLKQDAIHPSILIRNFEIKKATVLPQSFVNKARVWAYAAAAATLSLSLSLSLSRASCS